MSGRKDRVAVPSPAGPPLAVPPSDAQLEASTPTPPDLRIAVSPAQAAVGFGIIASLILLVLRRRRRRG